MRTMSIDTPEQSTTVVQQRVLILMRITSQLHGHAYRYSCAKITCALQCVLILVRTTEQVYSVRFPRECDPREKNTREVEVRFIANLKTKTTPSLDALRN
eukprot:4318573-Lingulodinium_polyedra.AAC.1